MKKLSLVVFAILFISANAFSQFYGGIKGGIVFSNFTGGHLGYKYKLLGEVGGTVGFMAEYVLNDYISLAPELFFSRKGTMIDRYDSTLIVRTDMYHLGYIEIPLLVKFRYSLDAIDLYCKLGPYFGLIGQGKASEKGVGIFAIPPVPIEQFFNDRNQEYTTFDVGWYLGTGAAIDFGPGKFLLEFHYDIGFQDIAQDEPSPYYYKNMGKNRASVIEVGYLYEF
ncbi:porin family protein [Bacteroidota bacterium]